MQNSPSNPVSARVLDADQVQWFPDGVQGDEAVRDGTTITSESYTYFNDRNDLTIEMSFTIECP